MILYIIINEAAVVEEEKGKIEKMLQELKYDYNFLGTYRSRNYSTLVIDFHDLSTNDDYMKLKNNIESICKVLEIDNYMKFYYLIKYGYAPKEINEEVKVKLNNKSVTYKIYNSHSQDGIFYVGLKILNMNPFDNNKVSEIKNLVEDTEGILELMEY